MALTIKVLGNNTVGSTTGPHELLTAYSADLYKVPSGKTVIVKNVRIVNRDTIRRSVTVNYLPAGANGRAVSPSAVSLPPGAMLLLDEELMLDASDKLQATFGETGANAVDFVVGGVERDV